MTPSEKSEIAGYKHFFRVGDLVVHTNETVYQRVFQIEALGYRPASDTGPAVYTAGLRGVLRCVDVDDLRPAQIGDHVMIRPNVYAKITRLPGALPGQCVCSEPLSWTPETV